MPASTGTRRAPRTNSRGRLSIKNGLGEQELLCLLPFSSSGPNREASWEILCVPDGVWEFPPAGTGSARGWLLTGKNLFYGSGTATHGKYQLCLRSETAMRRRAQAIVPDPKPGVRYAKILRSRTQTRLLRHYVPDSRLTFISTLEFKSLHSQAGSCAF